MVKKYSIMVWQFSGAPTTYYAKDKQDAVRLIHKHLKKPKTQLVDLLIDNQLSTSYSEDSFDYDND